MKQTPQNMRSANKVFNTVFVILQRDYCLDADTAKSMMNDARIITPVKGGIIDLVEYVRTVFRLANS